MKNGYRQEESRTRRRQLGVNLMKEGKYYKSLAKTHGDGTLIHSKIQVLPSGFASEKSIAAVKSLEKLRAIPYNEPAATKEFLEKQRIEEQRKLEKKSPKVVAQRRLKKIVQEMYEQEYRTRNNSNAESTVTNVRLRQVPETLRPKLQETFEEPMFDLIDQWRKDVDEIHRKRSSEELSADQNSELDYAKKRVREVTDESESKIPTLDDVYLRHGNAPAFYGVQRHPFPGRVPESLERKNILKKKPKTEWRDNPEEAVLQRAYGYMLGNICIEGEDNLELPVAKVSKEAQSNLDNLIQSNIGKGFWKDEVSSLIAAPLSASAFCSTREAQLFHAERSLGFDEDTILPSQYVEDLKRKYNRIDCRDDPHTVAKTCKREEPDQLTSPNKSHAESWEFNFSLESHQAATKITSLWKRRHAKRCNAASKVQKIARGMLGRAKVASIRHEKVTASIRIQAMIRGWFGRRILLYLRMALSYNVSIRDLASWDLVRVPTNLKICIARQRANEARDLYLRRVTRVATTVQSRFRGKVARRHTQVLREERHWQVRVAMHIQRIFRGRKVRQALSPVKQKIRLGLASVQARFRGNRQRKVYQSILSTRRKRAVVLQRVYRGHLGRRRVEQIRREIRAASKINALVRSRLARKHVRRWKIARREAEKKRLAEENEFIAREVQATLESTRLFLKTNKGRAQVKEEAKEAKKARRALQERRKQMSKRDLEKSLAVEAFELFDLDGSNEIDYDEFKQATKEMCLPLSRQQVVDAIHEMDANGDNVITKDEFVFWFVSQSMPADIEGPKGKPATSNMNKTMATFLRLKLKASKAVRDLSGTTDRRLATRTIYARNVAKARETARENFRKENPADAWYQKYVVPRLERASRRTVIPAAAHVIL